MRDARDRNKFTWADQFTVTWANYLGDASFALTGSLAAGMEGMDLLGCVIVGFVTALGGGTFREITLGRLPLFWMQARDEFTLCIVVATMTFFFWPRLSSRWRLTSTGEFLFWTDTIGLAVFAAAGSNLAAKEYTNLHLAACACCGMFTATFGGLTRDVLLGRPPRILYSTLEIYAVPALLGGLATAGFYREMAPQELTMESIMLGVWVVVHARVFAINHGLRLPIFHSEAVFSKVSTRSSDITLGENTDMQECLRGEAPKLSTPLL